MVETHDAAPVEGYEPEIGLLLAVLEDGTREWLGELGELDEEEIARRPFEGGPSIGAEIMHLAAVEAWWIQTVVGGQPLSEAFRRRTLVGETDVDAGRWGEAPKMPFSEYLALLEEVRQATREVLREQRDPARTLKPSPDRPGITVRWVVGHVVQHDSYHGGQAVVLRRILRGEMW